MHTYALYSYIYVRMEYILVCMFVVRMNLYAVCVVVRLPTATKPSLLTRRRRVRLALDEPTALTFYVAGAPISVYTYTPEISRFRTQHVRNDVG